MKNKHDDSPDSEQKIVSIFSKQSDISPHDSTDAKVDKKIDIAKEEQSSVVQLKSPSKAAEDVNPSTIEEMMEKIHSEEGEKNMLANDDGTGPSAENTKNKKYKDNQDKCSSRHRSSDVCG